MEIAVYNVLSWLYEIETSTTYALQQSHELYSGLGQTVPAVAAPVRTQQTSGSSNSSNSKSSNSNGSTPPTTRADQVAQQYRSASAARTALATARGLDGVKIIPFGGRLEDLLRKMDLSTPGSLASTSSSQVSKDAANRNKDEDSENDSRVQASDYEGQPNRGTSSTAASRQLRRLAKGFDVVVLGSRAVHLLDANYEDRQDTRSDRSSPKPYDPHRLPLIGRLLKPKAVVIAETVRNVVSVKAELRQTFTKRVIGMGLGLGAILAGTGRVLGADTYTVGTVLDPRYRIPGSGAAPIVPLSASSSASTATASKGDSDDSQAGARRDGFSAYDDLAPSLRYIRHELEQHRPRGGDNPPAEHLIFAWDATQAPRRRSLYARVEQAIATAMEKKGAVSGQTDASSRRPSE